ncbi:hypothetical protein LSAT2_005033, partial [Lamellibrachia satsuma]
MSERPIGLQCRHQRRSLLWPSDSGTSRSNHRDSRPRPVRSILTSLIVPDLGRRKPDSDASQTVGAVSQTT